MATVTIIDNNSGIARRTKSTNYPKVSFEEINAHTKITDISLSQKILGSIDYSIFDLADLSPKSSIQEISPFRIKFTQLGISNYPAGSAAPIGIAIIGYNNLIL